jgi:hypothetical protein
MKSVKELKEQIAEKVARASAIAQLAKNEKRDLTAEEVTEIDAIQGAGEAKGQVGELTAQLERAEKLEQLTRSTLTNRGVQLPSEGQQTGQVANIRVKPIAGKLKSFTGANAERDAWVSGHYFAATLFGNQSSKQWLGDHGYAIRNAPSRPATTQKAATWFRRKLHRPSSAWLKSLACSARMSAPCFRSLTARCKCQSELAVSRFVTLAKTRRSPKATLNSLWLN